MTEKTCGRCSEIKEVVEFSWRNKSKGTRQAWCKSCHKEVNNQSYATGSRKFQVQQLNTKYRKFRRKLVQRYKTYVGCQNCGYKKSSAALDLHHEEEKDITISRLVNGQYSIKRLRVEIRKCIVLCANCHRELHHGVVD